MVKFGQKKASLVLTLLLLLSLLSGCNQPGSSGATMESSAPVSSESASQPAETVMKLVDSDGMEIELEALPERIIALAPSIVEILFALDEGERLIAVGTYCNYPEAAGALEKLDSFTLNLERIIELEPDCLLLNSISSLADSLQQLSAAGIPVITIHADNIAETYDNIAILGQLTGSEDKADKLISDMKGAFAALGAKLSEDKPSVYMEVMPMPNPWTCGSGTFQDELIQLAGGINVFADVEDWAAVSEEQILERDPDVIITAVAPYEGYEDPLADLNSRQNWQVLSAYQNDRVYSIDGDIVARPGPRLVDAAEQLFELLHTAP